MKDEFVTRAGAADGASWLSNLKQLLIDSRKEAAADMKADHTETVKSESSLKDFRYVSSYGVPEK